ncbi:hypothetical protein ACFLUG_02725 [Chloroflexota bacterium]
MKVKLLLGIALVLIFSVVQIGPVLAQESAGEKWVVEYINSPDEGREFRQELDNNVGFETGSVNLNAGSVTYNYHKEKDGTVLHDYVIETIFDTPPEELIPGETIELNFSNRVVSNSRDIEVGNRYSYKVVDSNLGELARADIDLSTPSSTLTFQVPETNNGELVIFFNHQFFHDLGVEWRYRAGDTISTEAEPEVISEESDVTTSGTKDSEEEEFSESDFDELTEETLPDYLDPDPYETGKIVKPWGEEVANFIDTHVPHWFHQGLLKSRTGTATEQRGRIAPGEAEVYVFHKAFKKWYGPIKSEVPIYTGDIVVTAGGRNSVITFLNEEGKTDFMGLTSNTVLQVPILPEEYSKEQEGTLWSLYKGAVRVKRSIIGAIYKEAPDRVEERNPFLVRTPTVVCGIGEGRSKLHGSIEETPAVVCASLLPSSGNIFNSYFQTEEEWVEICDFIIQFDPETESSNIYINKGESIYYNLIMGGEEVEVLDAQESLLLKSNGLEYVDSMSQVQWERIVDENDLGNVSFPDVAEIEEFLGEDLKGTDNKGSGINPVIIAIIAVVVVVIVLVGLRKVKSNAKKI